MNEIADIHVPFMAYCNKIGLPFHRARSDKKSTIAEGDPDFLLTWMGHCVYIECKVPGRKLSEAQEKRIAFLRKAGNKVVIAYSLEECVEASKGILCHGQPEKDAGEASARENEPPVGIGDILSGRTQEPPDTMSPAFTAPEDGKLFIGTFGGSEYVFRGDPHPGGLAEMVRRASPEDIRELPRK